MYIRFHGNYSSPFTKQPYGIFVLIHHLKRDGKLSPADLELYENTKNWFEENLPNPPFYRENNNAARAVTWFKDCEDAWPLIERLQPLFDIAERYGVEAIKSIAACPPGKVIYEDEFQITVVM
ncbi:MAG: hypothetical protein K0R75_2988 [Paenibacillaceae bacterium]|jgi:hypothetical protein|nr:hypothetical protein [Paenibacillaceae bacterium]